MVTSLAELPKTLSSLSASHIDTFTQSISKLDTAIQPLVRSFSVINDGMMRLGPHMDKVVKSANSLSRAGSRTTNSFGLLSRSINTVRLKLLGLMFVSKKIGGAIGSWINATASYMETVQFFNITMGEFANQAGAYAKEVEAIMGINPDQWMRFQGTLMNISRGFGIAEESAYKMSKSLTEVAYDLSAMYNTDYETAFQKISSGLAGELEPLRRWGYALDQATLKELALQRGITKTFNTMTQAEKAQLRYIAVMEQSARMDVFGMMTREIMQPASAIRILRAQVDILSRTLGQLFIPILMKVIPYVIAFTKVVIRAVQTLATFLGFEMPKIASTTGAIKDLGAGIEDIDSGLKKTTKSAKEARKLLAGFDRLNVLQEPSSGGAGGGAGIGDIGGPGIDFGELPEHPGFLADIEAMGDVLIPEMERLFDILVRVGGAFTALWVGNKIIGFFKSVGGAIGALNLGWGKLTGWLATLGSKLATFSGIFPAMASGFKTSFGIISTSLGPILAPIGTAITGFFSGLWAPISTAISGLLTPITTAISGFITPIMTSISGFFTPIAGAIKNLFAPLISTVSGFLKPLLTVLVAPFQGVVGAIGTFVSPILIVIGVLSALGLAFYEIWNKSESFRDIVNKAFTGISDTFQKMWDTVLMPVGEVIKNMFSDIWKIAIKPLWDGFVKMVEDISTKFLNLWNNSLKPVVDWFIATFGPILVTTIKVVADSFSLALGFIGTYFGTAFRVIGSVVGGILDVIGGIITFITGVFTGDWKKAWNGISSIFSGIWNGLKGIVSGVWDGILTLFTKGGKIFGGIVSGIGNVFRDIINVLLTGVNSIIRAPFNVINGVLNFIRDISVMGLKPFKSLWGYNPIPVPQIPKIPKYEKGTNMVPETGLALLHKGETVIPATKQGDPYIAPDDSELLEILMEQNNILLGILDKDNRLIVDGQDLSKQLGKADHRRNKALGLT